VNWINSECSFAQQLELGYLFYGAELKYALTLGHFLTARGVNAMSDTVSARIARLCVDLEKRQTKESLTRTVVTARDIFGYETHVFGIRGVRNLIQPVQLGITNLSRTWQDHYDKNKLYRVDPFLRKAAFTKTPILMSDVTLSDDKEKSFADALLAQGVRHGMLTRAHVETVFLGVVFFGGAAPVSKTAWPEQSMYLQLFCSALSRAAAIYLKKSGEVERPLPELDEKELLALELTALGKTAEEVADEMRDKPRNVRHYLDRAVEKLNARNTRDAVTEALAQGLIRKRHFDDTTFKGSVE
jgi:DNA-binding NarL/FixJ family response regulator